MQCHAAGGEPAPLPPPSVSDLRSLPSCEVIRVSPDDTPEVLLRSDELHAKLAKDGMVCLRFGGPGRKRAAGRSSAPMPSLVAHSTTLLTPSRRDVPGLNATNLLTHQRRTVGPGERSWKPVQCNFEAIVPFSHRKGEGLSLSLLLPLFDGRHCTPSVLARCLLLHCFAVCFFILPLLLFAHLLPPATACLTMR
jgi:hypothetical protein